MEATGAGVYGQSVGRRPSISLGKYAKLFHADMYNILACVYEIPINGREEKDVNEFSDSQAAL
jgi:hypothetical protein